MSARRHSHRNRTCSLVAKPSQRQHSSSLPASHAPSHLVPAVARPNAPPGNRPAIVSSTMNEGASCTKAMRARGATACSGFCRSSGRGGRVVQPTAAHAWAQAEMALKQAWAHIDWHVALFKVVVVHVVVRIHVEVDHHRHLVRLWRESQLRVAPIALLLRNDDDRVIGLVAGGTKSISQATHHTSRPMACI